MARWRSSGSSFWRADWVLGILVTVGVLALHLGTDLVGTLERSLYDHASTQTSRVPADRVAVIAIDDVSVANLGRWPWSRDVHARLIDQLAAAQVKTIAYTVFFAEPQTDRGLSYIRQLRQALGLPPAVATTASASPAGVASAPSVQPAEPASAVPGVNGAGVSIAVTPEPVAVDPKPMQLPPGVLHLFEEAESKLDTDAQLAASIRRAGNVLLPAVFTLGEPHGNPDQPLPSFVQRNAVADPGGLALPAQAGLYPIAELGSAAAGVGHLNQFQDRDGAIRQDPLLVNYYGQAVPSMALLAAAHSLNLNPQALRLEADAVTVGKLRLPVAAAALLRPQFYPTRGERPAFAVDSFYDVVSGKIPATKYAGKVVLVGATAAGVGTLYPTPVSAALSPAETMAHVTSSILSAHAIVAPAWGVWTATGLVLLIAIYLSFGLPRLSAGAGAGATAALLLGLVGGMWFGLASAAIWLPLTLPAVLLVIGHLGLTTKRFLVAEAGKDRADEESAETNRLMGLALLGQGQLDMAFDRFQRVPFSDALAENLRALALDFERKRQFNKVQAVYEYMARHRPKDADVQAKAKRARDLSETVILGGGSNHPGGTLVLNAGGVEKPMLGRYQVEKELGKGAMGVVYQGRDPKIGRVVAIKTMALSQEFEGDELADARARFFREAETAGRLQHPHIVTIYDAGEEHDLAFIAMEFLKGRDLVEHARLGHLLPVPQVLSLVARVADALAYAHSQNVVHRDIKPANIMYESSTDTVKVTDFGIARITDSSRTKTGLVLGTPSYMSPEQIAGQRIEGASDLYSLGVTLFQLLTGNLPFNGDSLAGLMYQIANAPAPDVRSLRPELSAELAAVVARLLAKPVDARYADGAALAADLRALVGQATVAQGAASLSASPAVAAHGGAAPTVDDRTVSLSLAAGADDASATQVLAPPPGPPAGV